MAIVQRSSAVLFLTAAMIFTGVAYSLAQTPAAQPDTSTATPPPAATPPAATSPAAAPPSAPAPEAAKPPDDKPAANSTAAPANPSAAPVKQAVFPSVVDPKYSHEIGPLGRMRTCADQFTANKATDSNGGMKWIDRHGGYYLECSRHLKTHS